MALSTSINSFPTMSNILSRLEEIKAYSPRMVRTLASVADMSAMLSRMSPLNYHDFQISNMVIHLNSQVSSRSHGQWEASCALIALVGTQNATHLLNIDETLSGAYYLENLEKILLENSQMTARKIHLYGVIFFGFHTQLIFLPMLPANILPPLLEDFRHLSSN